MAVAVANGKSYQQQCLLGHDGLPSGLQSLDFDIFDQSTTNLSSTVGSTFDQDRFRYICVDNHASFQTPFRNTDPNYNRVCYNLSTPHNYTQTYVFS